MIQQIKVYLNSLFLWELIKGLQLTGKNLFRRKITIQYPEEKTPMSPRFRGHPELVVNEDGSP